jgi:hypothetical protein
MCTCALSRWVCFGVTIATGTDDHNDSVDSKPLAYCSLGGKCNSDRKVGIRAIQLEEPLLLRREALRDGALTN